MIVTNSQKKKRVLLGITGGIAAYKAAELARLLIQDGIEVQTVMTEAACHFLGSTTLQALTGKPVHTQLWDESVNNSMAHIDLSRAVDVILVAPASADFIAKIAHGLADDLLSTLCLARNCPLMVAPAMNRQMLENPATQRNLTTLQKDDITVLGPAHGIQACGETGMGRMLEPQELFEAVQNFFQPRLLEKKRILITAGPTFEAIDAVRGIINLSSGKMGYALAQAALGAGAEVTLISGPVCLTYPAVKKFIPITSANDMLTAVKNEVIFNDIFISVAAVADYRPAIAHTQKIKKSDNDLMLELIPNPDILQYVANLPNPPFCVGFAAETENIDQNAESKRHKKKLPLLVANLAQEAMGADDSTLLLFDDNGKHILPKAPKIDQARRLIAHIAALHKQHHS
ncbi:bifunctional phosphopantothenoylcysteine decarboxylase/phosphopantothenate--cysteine ligase CoaBC [Nitrosomonas sp. Is37]|uniref:bifunctional phosphopantothenoylcysteine decarboxylase/phosphopantothenate--cysteine ligase CoaBC n=1 Tax=Nitrosomonas sp. Is37 TaxID=3080535 RepID=UPI00294B202C|nr:bifunctional phosphopantothenoylcysteine decarboxylase/phosphopantothenate--cysteine ligase CoaBC [Nitrosomonas sp. Is37]MDV6343648.1 bifunctional phosphopantothenoylcysteine decarboxylase/phosphopantothenate--cysteine ligase CoaBC [Nitrosomonas sp. Is37]